MAEASHKQDLPCSVSSHCDSIAQLLLTLKSGCFAGHRHSAEDIPILHLEPEHGILLHSVVDWRLCAIHMHMHLYMHIHKNKHKHTHTHKLRHNP